MTTPGGVPNLPVGALTRETLASNLQDMSGSAMKARAVERFPSIMDGSTGLSPALEATPFGVLTRIYGEVTSVVATADPADIQGPEDIPQLLLQFIEGIPVVGQFVQLVKAVLGTYTGEDVILLTIQAVFDPIRKFLQMITGIFTGFPTVGQIELAEFPQHMVQGLTTALGDLGEGVQGAVNNLAAIAASIFNGWFNSTGGTGTPAEVTYTLEAIRDAVINGETVVTFAFDEVNWPVPTMMPDTVGTWIVIGGGQPGGNGGDASIGGGVGGIGGLHGSYKSVQVDLTGITHLDIKVGAAGNRTYVREANTTTPHTGTVIVESAPHGTAGGISTTYGFTPTTSLPGSGGNGATGGGVGTAGGSTPAATGGAGAGNNAFYGLPGGAGGSVSAGAQTKCGGAGGGGGGSAVVGFNIGGVGGPGGYPGGGGGGGGTSRNMGGTAGGSGAPGIAWFFYKKGE